MQMLELLRILAEKAENYERNFPIVVRKNDSKTGQLVDHSITSVYGIGRGSEPDRLIIFISEDHPPVDHPPVG